MGIDNFSTLTLSVYNNKGVYAYLLESGVSLEAKMMSGWKVTEDLIKEGCNDSRRKNLRMLTFSIMINLAVRLSTQTYLSN